MHIFRQRMYRRGPEPGKEQEDSRDTAEAPEDAGFIERATTRLRADWIEILSAAILALATIATAWCAYQSARWSGVMTINFAKSNTARTQSVKQQTAGGQLIQVDVGLFLEFVNAVINEKEELAEFVKEKWFSDDLKAATDAWMATDPIDNPDAPASPFNMPEYKSRGILLSQSYNTLGDSYRQDALDSNQRSDNYVLLAVLFATVLFFAGICTKFKQQWMQISFLVLAITILCVGTGILFTFPVY
jgi:hypothetical protein